MISRQIEDWLLKVSKIPKIIHIFGLRQTGKTTLMEAFRQNRYPKSLFYPLYDLVILRRYESNPEKWVLEIEETLQKQTSPEPLHIFVDEVQKIPAFFQAIQGLYEKHKEKLKFWIWGSSARPLKRKRAETLAGRSFSKTLWPLSQAEILKKESVVPYLFEPEKLKQNLDTEEPRDYIQKLPLWIQKTMLPEPCLMEETNMAHELLQSYQATYLENEIRRENLVEDIGIFEQFLALAAGEDTQIANYLSRAKVLSVAPHTIKSYYGILEDTFVCQVIPAYSKSLRVQTSKSPKIYFTDTGLARFIAGERGMPNENSAVFGKIIEGFVVGEITKQMEYHNLPWRLSYFRTKTGIEVDLVITSGQVKIAIEIKSSKKIGPADYKPILTLMALDKDISHGILFSRQSAPFQLEQKIYNFPIWNL